METSAEQFSISFGSIAHDGKGVPWVCLGFRITSVGSRSFHFAEEIMPGRQRSMLYTYNATHLETLLKKFPDLVVNHG